MASPRPPELNEVTDSVPPQSTEDLPSTPVLPVEWQANTLVEEMEEGELPQPKPVQEATELTSNVPLQTKEEQHSSENDAIETLMGLSSTVESQMDDLTTDRSYTSSPSSPSSPSSDSSDTSSSFSSSSSDSTSDHSFSSEDERADEMERLAAESVKIAMTYGILERQLQGDRLALLVAKQRHDAVMQVLNEELKTLQERNARITQQIQDELKAVERRNDTIHMRLDHEMQKSTIAIQSTQQSMAQQSAAIQRIVTEMDQVRAATLHGIFSGSTRKRGFEATQGARTDATHGEWRASKLHRPR